MGRVQQRAGGGLTQADKAKLVPENIRQGVTLFAGTAKEVTGTLLDMGTRVSLKYLGASLPKSGYVNLTANSRSGSFVIDVGFLVDLTHWKWVDFAYTSSSDTGSGTFSPTFRIAQNGAVIASSSKASQAIRTGGTASVDITDVAGNCDFNAAVSAYYSGSATGARAHTVTITEIALRR